MKTIAERLRFARDSKGWVQAQLAVAAGVSTGTIGNIESGARQSKGSIPQIADALGIRHKWLANGEGPMELARQVDEPKYITHISSIATPNNVANEEIPPYLISIDNKPDYPAIPRVVISVQDGSGAYTVVYLDNDGPPIDLGNEWFTSHNYQPDKMLAMRVVGDNMYPNLFDRDVIIINTAQVEPKNRSAFVVACDGELAIKRAVRDDEQWWWFSDNADKARYPTIKLNGRIVGEVVYRQTERI